MQNELESAKLFSPFAALKGFEEAIKKVENSFNNQNELSIDEKIQKLKIGDSITIKYFYGFDYIETSGKIIDIDKPNKIIKILNSEISFEDIIDIC